MKMLESIYKFILFIYTIGHVLSEEIPELKILGIEPNAGPDYGETRVTVRLSNLSREFIEKYPYPKCRFGGVRQTVPATYIKCTRRPRLVGEREALTSEKNETCIQCNDAPSHKPDIIPLTVSIIGDFSDVFSSVPFRYYTEPIVDWIYPRYGPKDGGTFVEVFGGNFLNFDQNLRCAFGSKETKAFYINSNYIICYTPPSDVTGKRLPFSVSLNNQQNSKQEVDYVYYQNPQIFSIEPNKGPDDGGTKILLHGQNFNPMKEIPQMNNANDTFCKFGNDTISPGRMISSTEMECISPPSYDNRYYILEISLNNREYTDDEVKFYYYHPPFVYSIYPKIGPVNGGTEVTIVGSNFEDTGFAMCKFGEKIVSGTYVNQNEIKCVAPKVEKPGKVNLALAIRPDEFSSGVNTIYRYYDTPILKNIEPICGPERGYTQIDVIGDKFPAEDSEYIKCVFNKTIFMNATVLNETLLKCDSPPVLNDEGINENFVDYYELEISLNGKDISGPPKNFYYYPESQLNMLYPIFGPLGGNTPVNVTAFGISHKNACNPAVRFSSLEIYPEVVNKEQNWMIVRSPPANYSGAVEVQLSLNGKDFDIKDTQVNVRDLKHTFYYYKFPIVTDIIPAKGPTSGKTKIDVLGLNLNAPFYFIKNTKKELTDQNENTYDQVVYYKFVDEKNPSIQYGETKAAKADGNSLITIESPTVYEDKLSTIIQLSYNKFDFETIPKENFVFYLLPNITSIEPQYGPLIFEENKKVKIHLDNYYCTEDCEKIVCKYSSKNLFLIEKGYYKGPNLLECDIPSVNSPEAYNVEVSFNDGEEFTNNKHTYTFYRPYVLGVEPQMIPSKGNTKLFIHGYGFADSQENLKVKFGNENIKCLKDLSLLNNNEEYFKDLNYNNTNIFEDCITNAQFINQNMIEVFTLPRKNIFDASQKQSLHYERFPLEVSVFNDDFTRNNLTIFYYDEPIIINDFSSLNKTNMFVGDENYKKEMTNNAVRSLPANIDTFIPLAINSNNIIKDFERINQFANYTCLFEKKINQNIIKKDEKKIYKITDGLISSVPKNSKLKNIFFCQSPEWKNIGDYNLKISLNGKDFSESYYDIKFIDPLEILHIEPTAGPLTGDTDVDIYGTGLDQFDEDFHFKWGIFTVTPFKDNLLYKILKTPNAQDVATDLQSPAWLMKYKSEFTIEKIRVRSPPGYSSNIRKSGGPAYISLTKSNYINYYSNSLLNEYGLDNNENSQKNETNKSYIREPFEYIHSNFEFYYYREPYIQAINPHGSIVTGGTEVIVYGAWFAYLPQYGVKPYCKFGEKIVEGKFLSTVRIMCRAPPSNKANVRVPLEVSLNKKDFSKSDLQFIYFNDFKNAKFDKMEPLSGPQTGGTQINLYGRNFTNLVNPEEFLCEFKSEDETITPKVVPAGFKFLEDSEQSAIICNSPGGWKSGTKAKISITFDGQNFMDTGFNFYFYKTENIYPLSGPNVGNGPINIIGGGFKDSKKVKCILEGMQYEPELISETEVKCPMNPAKGGLNFTGLVDIGIILNGIDINNFSEGFYYYNQPIIHNIYPKFGPSKGKGIVKVFGDYFKDNFKNANPMCKIGNIRGKSNIINKNELNCEFDHIPLLPINKTLNFSYALNNYSFTEGNPEFYYIPYGINKIMPSSGPINGATRIEVFGAGFFDTNKARCRFGVPGYFYYTEAQIINYNLLICSSPLNFKIPNFAEIPFSIPFSIAFSEDDFNPWTDTSHYFTFYENPEITQIYPTEGKTSVTTEVFISSSKKNPFSTPSAIVIEEDVIDYTHSIEGEVTSKSSIAYQPITCRFGTFGVTQGYYYNRTLIKCLSPVIQDDSDLGYEDINLEIALNGVDYYSDPDIVFTFIGPAAGRMLWIYIIISILTALLLIIFACLISSYWNRLNLSTRSRDVFSSDQPHVYMKRPRYIVQHSRQELQGDLLNQQNNNVQG